MGMSVVGAETRIISVVGVVLFIPFISDIHRDQ